jgi:hypothetical protein
VGEVSPRAVARVAYVAAGLNLAAAAAMVMMLQPGLPVAGSVLEERTIYVQERTAAWWAGWLLWHAAALALIAFYVGLAGLWWRRAPMRCGLALLCAAAGLAADVSAVALYMGVAPRLSGEGFEVVERVAGMLSGYVGNGLYTLAGFLLVWAGASQLPRPLLALSVPVWVAGLGLSVATLTQSTDGQFWGTAVLMPAFVLWAGSMGRWLSARAS